MAIAVVLAYFVHFTEFGSNIMDLSLTVLLLFAGATILVTFKFGKRPTTMTAEVIRGERMLLYNTAFITFWLVLSRLINIVRSYILSTTPDSELLLHIIYDLTNLCGLFANPGALLVLYYLSSPLRKEFHYTFRHVFLYRVNKQPVGSLPTVYTT